MRLRRAENAGLLPCIRSRDPSCRQTIWQRPCAVKPRLWNANLPNWRYGSFLLLTHRAARYFLGNRNPAAPLHIDQCECTLSCGRNVKIKTPDQTTTRDRDQMRAKSFVLCTFFALIVLAWALFAPVRTTVFAQQKPRLRRRARGIPVAAGAKSAARARRRERRRKHADVRCTPPAGTRRCRFDMLSSKNLYKGMLRFNRPALLAKTSPAR